MRKTRAEREGRICIPHIKHLALSPHRGLYSHGFSAPVTRDSPDVTFYEVSAGEGTGHEWVVRVYPPVEDERPNPEGDGNVCL